MEREPENRENEFQSDYNTDSSNMVSKASKLLALYEMIRLTVINFVGGLYKKLLSSDNKNTIYIRLFTVLGTFLLYIFDYLSLKVLSTIMFFDVLIKSFRQLSSVNDQNINDNLVKQWVTYACVTSFCTILDILTSLTMFLPIKIFLAFCKLFLCYKLVTDANTSDAILNSSLKFYHVNKRGLDGLHDTGVTALTYVKSMCS